MKWNKYSPSTTRQRKQTHEQMRDKQKVKQTAGLYSWPLPTLLVPNYTQSLPSSQMNCPSKFIFKNVFISVFSALCSFSFYSSTCASPLFFTAQHINSVVALLLLHKDRWLPALSIPSIYLNFLSFSHHAAHHPSLAYKFLYSVRSRSFIQAFSFQNNPCSQRHQSNTSAAYIPLLQIQRCTLWVPSRQTTLDESSPLLASVFSNVSSRVYAFLSPKYNIFYVCNKEFSWNASIRF